MMDAIFKGIWGQLVAMIVAALMGFLSLGCVSHIDHSSNGSIGGDLATWRLNVVYDGEINVPLLDELVGPPDPPEPDGE